MSPRKIIAVIFWCMYTIWVYYYAVPALAALLVTILALTVAYLITSFIENNWTWWRR